MLTTYTMLCHCESRYRGVYSRHMASAKLKHCISDIQAFFVANKLCCKFETEIVYFHSRLISVPPLAGINISHYVESTSKEA